MKHSMATFQLNSSSKMEQVENSQTISVPPNVLKIKCMLLLYIFVEVYYFTYFKKAVLNVAKQLKCFR